MLPEPELRRALAEIPPVPLHGPFNRFVSFDAMVSGQSSSIVGPRRDPQGKRVFEGQVIPLSWAEQQLAKRSLLPSQSLGNPLPLWGIGSLRNGARYNKPGTFEVVYLAEDPITALAEVDLVFRPNADLGKIKGPPMVHIAVDGILENVLDVTLAEVQNTLATSHQELTGAWLWDQSSTGEAPTQRLGRIAFEKELLHGLRYPSSKNPGGVCVAVFPDRLASASYLEVFDPFGNLAQRIPPIAAITPP